jgi:hypothetical protein
VIAFPRRCANEEQILWRSLERIPELYREPLVLFYREHQSIEAVAQNLDLSTDVVKQRLSRGRKMLQEQVIAFVEGTLGRTNPGKIFTLAVQASLPGLTISAKAATASITAAGSATAKTVGTLGWVAALSGPLIVFLPNYIAYRIALAGTKSSVAGPCIKAVWRKAGIIILGLFLPFAAMVLWVSRNQHDRSFLSGLFATGLTFIYLPAIIVVAMLSARRYRMDLSRELAEKIVGLADHRTKPFPAAARECLIEKTPCCFPLFKEGNAPPPS